MRQSAKIKTSALQTYKCVDNRNAEFKVDRNISPPAVDFFFPSMCVGLTGLLSSALLLSFPLHTFFPSLHLDLVCSMAPLPSLSFCSMRPERVVGGLAAGGRAAGLASRRREPRLRRLERQEARRSPLASPSAQIQFFFFLCIQIFF